MRAVGSAPRLSSPRVADLELTPALCAPAEPARTFALYNILLTLIVLILAVLVQRTLTGKNLYTGQKHILY
jgi:hypothetical protein